MATITIRNLDETVKRRLQVRAALNGRSMEAEARELLSEPSELPLGAREQAWIWQKTLALPSATSLLPSVVSN